MALIKQVKSQEKSKISVTVNKKLADEFTQELEKFTANNMQNVSLDFDNLAKKLIAELKKLNDDNSLFTNENKSSN
jgi:hypothetical protein